MFLVSVTEAVLAQGLCSAVKVRSVFINTQVVVVNRCSFYLIFFCFIVFFTS